MVKKPITILFTDIHLTESNCNDIQKILVKQGIPLCKKYKIKNVFCLGDVFDSRVGQKQSVLNVWSDILDKFNEEDIFLNCIRGNHDSSDYTSKKSFLTPYRYHPGFQLIDDIEIVPIENYEFYCIAYWSEEIWIKRFEELKSTILNNDNIICLGHQAITGSNNKGYSTENRLKLNMFEDFKLTLMGHFHDYQKIGDKFYHLGALTQTNYGEDSDKGFWILYNDLTLELIPSESRKFKKLTIDLREVSNKQMSKIIDKFKEENEGDFIRIEFQGSKDLLSGLDVEKYRNSGFDIKKKVFELECNDVENIVDEIKCLSNQDIFDRFKIWCEENEYDYKSGINILKRCYE